MLLELPEAEGKVELAVSYGFQNLAKSRDYLPIEIEITNESPKNCDKLYIEIENIYGNNIKYGYDINIPSKTKESFSTAINVPDYVDSLLIRVETEDGELLSEHVEAVDISQGGSEILIGLLSNEADSLSYLRGISLSESGLSTRTVVLNPSSMPVSRAGLEQLDMIVISDFDMNRLSEHIEPIYEWVRDGGVLLIGTGAARDPLKGFEDRIAGLEISEPETMEVNMGIRYSTDGPDGALLDLAVREIYADGGIQAMQSGSLAVLTNINEGNGVIGIAAYSLCDISEFCFEQLGYVEELVGSLMGSTRIRQLDRSVNEKGSLWQQIRAFTDVADNERIPNVAVYLFIAIAYAGLCIPLMYFVLKLHGLSMYYPFGIAIASFVTVIAIWIAGYGTRFENDAIDYASITYVSDDSINETYFIKIMPVKKGELSLELQGGSDAMPILPSGSDRGEKSLWDTDYGEYMELYHGDDSLTRISIGTDEAFSEFYFETRRYIDNNGSNLPSAVGIRYFEDELSGELINETDMDLRNVSLLMFGRIIKVGDIGAGESVRLEGIETVYGPTGSAELTSAYITGMDDPDASEDNRSRLIRETQLLSYYLRDMMGYYYQDIRLVAFVEDTESPVTALEDMEAEGIGLIVANLDVDFTDGRNLYRSALATEPRIVSGSYDIASNTISGSSAAVIEYRLGTDISVEAVRFNRLSERFWGRQDENGDKLVPFSGAMSIYNYSTGSYDLMDSDRIAFTDEEIRPYMSPENAIMVRYIPDENTSEDSKMFLPVPTVTGVG